MKRVVIPPGALPATPSSRVRRSELTAILDSIENDTPYNGVEKKKMKLGVDVLPRFTRDNTDRNRTSPFAFTGNKFEFRMPGKSREGCGGNEPSARVPVNYGNSGK